MKFIVLLAIINFANMANAAVVNSVYLHGVVTNNFQNDKYISVRDSFEQEYILPKKLIEKKTGRKIAGNKSREFKGAIYFFEISTKEYSAMYSQCQSDIKPSKLKTNKMCPPAL